MIPEYSSAVEFDVKRAYLRNEALYPPLHFEQTRSLSAALQDGGILPDTRVLVMPTQPRGLVFEALHLIHHHVAMGIHEGTPIVASFCPICNAGTVFDGRIDGETRHFEARGLYNAMVLLGDVETGSYWDHLSGKCVHGKEAGKSLKFLTPLLHSRADQAAIGYPDAQLVVTHLTPEVKAEAEADAAWGAQPTPEWSKGIISTLVTDDTRLPRLEMGLGVWSPTIQRFYQVRTLYAQDNFVLDQFDGRTLLVYISPETSVPDAMFVEAKSAQWRGEQLHLSNGSFVRDNVLYNTARQWQAVERPHQLFSRWYSFAIQYANCSIYGA